MSDTSRLMKQGMLGELRDKLAALEDRAEGIIGSLQVATFVQSSVWVLDSAKIRNYGIELAHVITEGNEIRSRIESLETDLGIKW